MAHRTFKGQVRPASMDNITLVVVNAVYAVALLLFAVVAGMREMIVSLVPGQPPAFPLGKVPVWLYRRGDLFGAAGIFGIFYLFAMANLTMEPKESEPALSVTGIVFSIGFQFFMAVAVSGIVIGRTGMVHWLGLKWKQWPLVAAIAPVAVLTMWALFAGLYAVGYMDLMEKLGVEKVQEVVTVFQTEKDPLLLGLMAFAAAIVAPLCEEVVFRGYLYPVLKKFSGPWIGALCSALVFSAAHGSLSALLPLFVFGLVLVALYEWTGSIWTPIAVHFLFNSATVAIQLAGRFYGLPIDGP